MRRRTQNNRWKFGCGRRLCFWLAVTAGCLILLGTLFVNNGITGVEGYGYDDYGGGDPYGGPGGDKDWDEAYDIPPRHDMMNDIDGQPNDEPPNEPPNYPHEPSGYPHEGEKKKKFKLFEKRRLNYEQAKTFCKKREGQLSKAMHEDDKLRIRMLLEKGTTLSTNVWVGATKREWREAMKSEPESPPETTMTEQQPADKCPSMSMPAKQLTPVECYKAFAFICELPLGNSTAQPKIPKPEKRKKDEMRRKREVLGLDPTDQGQISVTALPPVVQSTSESDASTTQEENENAVEGAAPESNEADEVSNSITDYEDQYAN